MFKKIYAQSINHDYEVNRPFQINIPTMCPYCNHSTDPKILSSHYIEIVHPNTDNEFRIFVTFLCTTCQKSFNSEYYTDEILYQDTEENCLNPETTYPVYHATPKHSEHIKNLSERYVKIYDQAYFAEESNLTEICGMGYRKALEFLIKDFAIMLHKDKVEEIKKTSLSQCIQNYIDNTRIKNTAKASTWLGNDETHYCRKHEDYSLKELKHFLESTEYFINSELENIEAEKLINARKQ